MKLFKSILNYIIAILLLLSVVINIFVISALGIHDMNTLREAILAKELMAKLSCIESNGIDFKDVNPTPRPAVDPIYEDEYVRVTYLRYEEDLLSRNYKFLIENLSNISIIVVFDEVCIDGFKVELSGLHCDNLAGGINTIEYFKLYRYEWEEFTSNPNRANFRVRVIDANDFSILHETVGKLNFNL